MSATASRRRSISPGQAVVVVLTAIAVWVGVFYWQNHRHLGQAHIDAGNEYARRGDGQNALREWQLATQVEPGNAFAWQLIGQSYFVARRWEPAREALQHVARLDPHAPHLYSLLASCAHNRGDPDAALAYAHAAIERDPNDVPALEVAAAEETRRGNTVEITRWLRRLTELEPNNIGNLVALAQVLMRQSEVTGVIPVLDRVIQLQPDNAEMYTLRGIARFYSDGTADGQQRCEDDLAHAMSIKPSLYACSLYLGRIYRRRGQLDTAARFLTNATHLNPNKPDAFFDLAGVEERRGHTAQAVLARARFQALAKAAERYNHLRKQCDVSPENFNLNLTVGVLALRRDDVAMAGRYLARAAQLRPTDERVRRALRELTTRSAQASALSLPTEFDGSREPVAPAGRP